jgi:hypothetical protein
MFDNCLGEEMRKLALTAFVLCFVLCIVEASGFGQGSPTGGIGGGGGVGNPTPVTETLIESQIVWGHARVTTVHATGGTPFPAPNAYHYGVIFYCVGNTPPLPVGMADPAENGIFALMHKAENVGSYIAHGVATDSRDENGYDSPQFQVLAPNKIGVMKPSVTSNVLVGAQTAQASIGINFVVSRENAQGAVAVVGPHANGWIQERTNLTSIPDPNNPGEKLPGDWSDWIPDENGNVGPNGHPDGSMPFNPPVIADTNALILSRANWDAIANNSVFVVRFKQFRVHYYSEEMGFDDNLNFTAKLVAKSFDSPVFRLKMKKLTNNTVEFIHEEL